MIEDERFARAARLREFLDHPDVKDALAEVEADEALEAAEAADGLEPGQVAWPLPRFYFTDAAE